jgi:hypothetical protein
MMKLVSMMPLRMTLLQVLMMQLLLMAMWQCVRALRSRRQTRGG